MSEQEEMDRLLHDMMAPVPRPQLSPAFDRRLAHRLRPRRLDATRRLVLAVYCVVAMAVSIWAMRHAATDWSLIVVAVLVPVMLVVAARRRLFGSTTWFWSA